MAANGLMTSYHNDVYFFCAKTNPDAHYSRESGKNYFKIIVMYSTDRLYGLKILPRRPWEKFKDPENNFKRIAYRHNRTPVPYI